ncbi:DNA-processing protein DprA [Peribacillus saganii]|uniref:DNA-processing protein DprA n=1 Tax=Peribacillus saganii TaxID=2303992 RepID=UPI0026A2DFFF|nr:DNA-processing protein DprA [Peribacillus saganii]
MEVRERLLHLHHCRGIGWKSIFYLLKKDPHLKSLYSISFAEWKQILSITVNQLNSFYHDLHTLDISKLLGQYGRSHIDITTFFDAEYPDLLKEIYNPPWVLYSKGDRKIMKEQSLLGIVGSRKPTAYGLAAIKEILPALIKENIVVVSGLASGIDATAHKLTLEHSGKTIAVLGGGLFHLYPKEELPLASKLIDRGLLISEMPPNRRPEPWMFPMRNRVISGLSKGVLIVEAEEKSGSLITAQCAIEQNREVFALPGNITSRLSKGTNSLIQEGAKPVLSAQDIISEMNFI